jgi:hypothetical protein
MPRTTKAMKKKFEQQLAHLLNFVEQSVEVVPDKCLVEMLYRRQGDSRT